MSPEGTVILDIMTTVMVVGEKEKERRLVEERTSRIVVICSHCHHRHKISGMVFWCIRCEREFYQYT